jgi:hypothetical protein
MEMRYQREERRVQRQRLLVSLALGVAIGGVIGTLRVLSMF